MVGDHMGILGAVVFLHLNFYYFILPLNKHLMFQPIVNLPVSL
jgi:hypothetical protein